LDFQKVRKLLAFDTQSVKVLVRKNDGFYDAALGSR